MLPIQKTVGDLRLNVQAVLRYDHEAPDREHNDHGGSCDKSNTVIALNDGGILQEFGFGHFYLVLEEVKLDSCSSSKG